MMTDPVRGRAYVEALRHAVRPGCVVADIGAGPGVLGVIAATLGARRVFLVEPSEVVAAALALAHDNGVEDRVEVIEGASTEITLPEQADVIVSDLRGVLPLFGNHLRAAADMRRRLLAPGGICIPARDELYLGLVQDESLHSRTAGAWSALSAMLDVGSLARIAHSRWHRTHASAEQLLGPAVHWATLDYTRTDTSVSHGRRVWLEIERDGTLHGLLCWFDASLTASVGFSNAPSAPRALYGQAFFPLDTPVKVIAGDRVDAHLRAVLAGADYEWAWSVDVVRDGVTMACARHATIDARPGLRRAVELFDGARQPAAVADASAIAQVIAMADGETTMASIAEELRAKFTTRFPTNADALEFAVRQHARFSS
ncbi:MAG TPA: 50S ribosomal protein L11 methyltransferase [Gemmatimonadaceae bacterium]|nr:50S ribosomal protein L11 methyltransferase [Gemmatimonadaceae bacterium]